MLLDILRSRVPKKDNHLLIAPELTRGEPCAAVRAAEDGIEGC